jgi:hypothetical protein
MFLYVSDAIEQKILEFHKVTVIEAEEAFSSFNGKMLEDDRAKHRTKPPTYWFLSETYDGRLLKLVMKILWDDKIAFLRTAYEPSDEEINYYEKNT